MKSWIYALLFLLIASNAVAYDSPLAAAPEYLTKEQVLTLPTEELARRMLQGAASRFVEVSRPDPSYTGTIEGVDFATAPLEITPGLCLAVVLDVRLEKPLYAKPYNSQPPVRANWISTYAAYKILDSAPSQQIARRKNNSAKSQPLCETAGPVLPSEDHIGFFKIEHADHENMMTTAYEALRLMVTNGYATDTKLVCEPLSVKFGGTTECSDIPGLLRSLKLSDLNQIGFGPCADQLGVYCIEGRIYRKPKTAQIQFWGLNIRVRLRHPGNVPDDVEHINSITISDGWGFSD